MTRDIPEVEMWDPMVTPCLDFSGTTRLFSVVATPENITLLRPLIPFKAALPDDSHAITHAGGHATGPDSDAYQDFPSLHGGGGALMDQDSLVLQAALSAHTMLGSPVFRICYWLAFHALGKDRNLSPGS